jgi:hypothetical protein
MENEQVEQRIAIEFLRQDDIQTGRDQSVQAHHQISVKGAVGATESVPPKS